MNTPEQNNYIQYVTKLDIVKTKSVVFTDNGINTTFKVEGITEEFFILSVFQNNIRILGVGFDDLENNDMLGFLNSEMTDLSLIPKNAFLSSEQVVTMSYNNEYLKENKTYQQTNEYKYFDNFLKYRYPTKKYVITPYYWTNNQLGSSIRNMYYCTLNGSLVSSNMGLNQPDVYTNTHNYILFNTFVKQNSDNGPYALIIGYNATFDQDLWIVPPPPPVIDK